MSAALVAGGMLGESEVSANEQQSREGNGELCTKIINRGYRCWGIVIVFFVSSHSKLIFWKLNLFDLP